MILYHDEERLVAIMHVIGFINESDQKRGIQRIATELCKRTGADLVTFKRPLSFAPRIVRKISLMTLSYNFSIPRELARTDADIFHAFSPLEAYPLVKAKRRPIIINSYDLLNMNPHRQDLLFQTYSRFLRNYDDIAYRNADRIVCVSETHRRDILSHLQVDPQRLRVIYPGVSQSFHPIEKRSAKARLGVSGRMIFMLPDSILDVSGVPSTLKAFLGLKGDSKFADVQLRIAGIRGPGKEHDELLAMIRESGLSGRVTVLPFLTDDELNLNYNAADVFVHCDLSEEFNLPPLEAMACATPVINLGDDPASMNQIYGDGALFVEHGKAQTLKEALVRVLGDADLQADLARKAVVKAGEFSWEVAAKKTLELYNEVSAS